MLRVSRRELKFMMRREEAVRLQNELDGLLSPDRYAGGGDYMVRSLYFDSVNNIDYWQKVNGDECRKKLRLRIYDTAQPDAKLELKKKDGGSQQKLSLTISREAACRLAAGSFDALFSYGRQAEEFYALLTLGAYRPAAIIEYYRRAYTDRNFNTRVTFDRDVKSCGPAYDLWSESLPLFPVSPDGLVILEVKYDGALLEPIRRVLAKYRLTNVSYGKYGNGRMIV